MKPLHEISISTQQGEIVVVEMGNPKGIPVIALHGWLDNAASFIPLAEHIEALHIYALDLAGHGKSYHRAFPHNYNQWDDLLDILEVADYLGLEKFAVLGHSRGAGIACALSAVSDRVTSLALLDGFIRSFSRPEEAGENIAEYIAKRRRGRNRRFHYKTLEEMIKLRMKSKIALAEPAARLITERNVEAVEPGFVWRTDPALRWRSAVRFSETQVNSVVEKINCPTGLWVTESSLASSKQCVASMPNSTKVSVTAMQGSHHFHMETGVKVLAQNLDAFFSSQLKPL